MALRATMADLITHVRGLVGDPAGATQTFADLDYQDELDRRRSDVVEAELSFRPTMVGGGPVVQYEDYWAPSGNWETGPILKSAANVVLTPDVSELLHGHWTFTAGQLPPVFITGSFYDIYGAAAAILDRWYGLVALQFDFKTDNQDFALSQKRRGLAELALIYRRRAIQPGQRPPWRSSVWRTPVW